MLKATIRGLYRQRPSIRQYLIACSIIWCLLAVLQLGRWNENHSSQNTDHGSVTLIDEALENIARDLRYMQVYRKPSKLPKDTKYILLWNSPEYEPFPSLAREQRAFISHDCSFINCYVTSNRKFFKDVKDFDAIAFNGRFVEDTLSDLPKSRSPHQKYIFFNMESADYYPVCARDFNGFFNWTATYRLDSDIMYGYFEIFDLEGNKVGPKSDMVWIQKMASVNDSSPIIGKIRNKTKAAAWFVSNCNSLSGRNKYVKKLQKALRVYDLTVDVYGLCGPYECINDKKDKCGTKLQEEYFFYLALENSFAEDYVTEKIFTALKHYTVPVVFGGANYSRFLPPGSYLDARQQSPSELAYQISLVINSLQHYKNFFNWRNHYTYKLSYGIHACGVCAALNNKTLINTKTVYWDFRKWWNPDFREQCTEEPK